MIAAPARLHPVQLGTVALAAAAAGLAVPVFALAVLDRVIAAGAQGTLASLGGAMLLALGFDGVLRVLRSRWMPAGTEIVVDATMGLAAFGALAGLVGVRIAGPLVVPTLAIGLLLAVPGIRRLARAAAAADGARRALFAETVRHRAALAVVAAPSWAKRYRTLSAAAALARYRWLAAAATLQTAVRTLAGLAVLGVLALAATALGDGILSTGGLVAATILAMQVQAALSALAAALLHGTTG